MEAVEALTTRVSPLALGEPGPDAAAIEVMLGTAARAPRHRSGRSYDISYDVDGLGGFPGWMGAVSGRSELLRRFHREREQRADQH
jgi:hypothetical protein